MTRKADHWILTGCRHFEELFAPTKSPLMPQAERDAYEKKWDAEAERLFGLYTYAWTDKARETFKERIWPTPPPVIPTELIDRYNNPVTPADIAAVKAWNAAHPAGNEEDTGAYF